MSMEMMFSALESSRLARTCFKAEDALVALFPAGEGMISALFRSSVLSFVPFDAG
jgi:hypothetical protein